MNFNFASSPERWPQNAYNTPQFRWLFHIDIVIISNLFLDHLTGISHEHRKLANLHQLVLLKSKPNDARRTEHKDRQTQIHAGQFHKMIAIMMQKNLSHINAFFAAPITWRKSKKLFYVCY